MDLFHATDMVGNVQSPYVHILTVQSLEIIPNWWTNSLLHAANNWCPVSNRSSDSDSEPEERDQDDHYIDSDVESEAESDDFFFDNDNHDDKINSIGGPVED